MSLSNRQLQMIQDLSECNQIFLTSAYFAQKYHISIRTIQKEMTVIKDEIRNLTFLELKSIPSKGSKVIVYDEELLKNYIKLSQLQSETINLNSKETRIKKIILILFCTKKSITVQHLADRLFISKSTLMNDLRAVEDVFEHYSIKIHHNNQQGLFIVGNEVDLRRCVSKEQIDIFSSYNDILENGHISANFRKIGTILVKIFTEYRFRISDVALQNLIVHVNILIQRIQMGFVLQEASTNDLEKGFQHEIEIAEKILEACQKVFQVPIINSEISRLAIYLRGKSNYSDDSYITQEIDDFVLDTLLLIKQKYNIDLLDDVQLRVSLSLHLIPLLTRLKYNMQLKNELLTCMRSTFQVAIDIASSFSYRIQEVFGYTLIEDEISFLAIYFNVAFDIQQEHVGTNNILIISSLKRCETLLLRERINSWFSNAILELKIEDIYHLENIDMDEYNVILTTEKNRFFDYGLATLISQFPTEEDYRSIQMALDGFNGTDEILALFQEAQIFFEQGKDKNKIIYKLCDTLPIQEQEKQALQEEVIKRENMGGTLFGNLVAMPHPMYPITNQTYIAVGILNDEIDWDIHGNKARLVLLVSLQKNNPKAYRIWSYLSELTMQDSIIQTILENPTYTCFIEQMSVLLKKTNR